jgi:hypothetical protein
MNFRSLGFFYNFECFLIFKFKRLLLRISREQLMQFAVDLRKVRPQLKGASLASLRFVHAHSCLLHPIALKEVISIADHLSSDHSATELRRPLIVSLPNFITSALI